MLTHTVFCLLVGTEEELSHLISLFREGYFLNIMISLMERILLFNAPSQIKDTTVLIGFITDEIVIETTKLIETLRGLIVIPLMVYY